jgi:hypothetical protein
MSDQKKPYEQDKNQKIGQSHEGQPKPGQRSGEQPMKQPEQTGGQREPRRQ